MGRRTWPKLIGLAAVALSAAIALSGCAAIIGYAGSQIAHNAVPKKANPKTFGEPKVGDCWRGSYDDIGYANWGSSKPVSCSEPHQFYTYAVLQLKEEHDGSEFDAQDYVKTALDNDAQDVCRNYQEGHWSEFTRLDQRLYFKPFLPSDVKWSNGARWVRCDFNIFALGSPLASPTLEDIPTIKVLASQMNNQSTVYNYCVDVPGGNPSRGPKAAGAVYASCSTAEWILKGYFDFYGSANDAYPSHSKLVANYDAQCKEAYTDATHVTFGIYPSKSDWNSGEHDSECWARAK